MKLDINHVSQITGLTVHTLRAWEKRYSVVSPMRVGKNRVFTYEDVERLKTLRDLVAKGIPIRKACQMSEQDIDQELPHLRGHLLKHRKKLIQLISSYKLGELVEELHHHRVRRGTEEFLIKLIGPLMSEIGRLVATGELGVDQEHAVTSLVREQIVKTRSAETDTSLPLMGFCTQEGDFHEMGILMAAKLAESRGYPVFNFGPNLPAQALVDIVKAVGPKILVIGTTPTQHNLDQFPEYLKVLKSKNLNSQTIIWIAGELAGVDKGFCQPVFTMEDFLERL